jgi:hypothetical protein
MGVVGLSMALAVTVFAIVDGVLFKPLPYSHVDDLYVMSGGYQRGQSGGIAVAPRNARDWEAAVPGAAMTLWNGGGGGGRFGDVHDWVPSAVGIDARFFDVLGVRPLIGGFQPIDFEADVTPPPVIISYALWQSMFGGRPDVIGQRITVDTVPRYRVAGVLPRDFLFPITYRIQPNILLPRVVPPDRDDLRYRCCNAIARMPSNGSLERSSRDSMRLQKQRRRIGFRDQTMGHRSSIESVLSRSRRPSRFGSDPCLPRFSARC